MKYKIIIDYLPTEKEALYGYPALKRGNVVKITGLLSTGDSSGQRYYATSIGGVIPSDILPLIAVKLPWYSLRRVTKCAQ